MWYVAPCLNTLLAEFDVGFPGRSKVADGSIGDTSHQARPSDHNPDWGAGGVVRARDFTHSPPTLDIHKEVRKPEILKDPRNKYIISQGQIMASYPVGGYAAYSPRPYHGSNGHYHHAHVSIKSGRLYEDDKSRWYDTTLEAKLDAETKAKLEELDAELEDLKVQSAQNYKALYKLRRDENGTPILDGNGDKIYDEHLNVVDAKLDEALNLIAETMAMVKQLGEENDG